jgi:hypothetical protein
MASMMLFSAVSGQVLENGKPVPGALVEREFCWAWKQESGTDSTTTDADGAFSLPAIKRRSLLGGLLPREPFVEQTILIQYDGQTYQAWMFNKGNYEDEGELGRPIVLSCRLENESSWREGVFGICEII